MGQLCIVTREEAERWIEPLFVRAGKGQKDRVSFVGPTTTRAIRDYLAMRTLASREDWLFVDVEGRPLKIRHLVQVLHRLRRPGRASAEPPAAPTRAATPTQGYHWGPFWVLCSVSIARGLPAVTVFYTFDEESATLHAIFEGGLM